MNIWYRIVSLVQILIIEIITSFCLASALTWTFSAKGILGCPGSGIGIYHTTYLGAWMVGLIGLAWFIWRTAWPKELHHAFRSRIGISGVNIPNPFDRNVKYAVPSTHPSYVGVDLILLAPAYFFIKFTPYPPMYSGCTSLHSYLLGWIVLGVSVFFPLFRLFCWYLLSRQLPKKITRSIWKSVIILITISYVCFLSIPLMVYIPYWKAPWIQGTNFQGGFTSHPELLGKLVNVRARIKHPAVPCYCSAQDPTSCRVAAMLLELEQGVELIAYGISSESSKIRFLGSQGIGKKVTLSGILKPIPPVPPEKENQYIRIDCGWEQFGQPSSEGRFFLQVENP